MSLKTKLTALGAAGTLALAAGGVAASSAQAASGCTDISNWSVKGVGVDNVCIATEGASGNYAETLRASLLAPTGVQNAQLRLTTFDVNGNQVSQRYSQIWTGNRTNETFEVHDVTMPTGKVCAEVGSSGSWSPGACLGVYP